MKKSKLLLFFLIALLVLSLIGCGKDSLKAYKEAVKKTDEIKKAQESINLTIESEFNTEGLSTNQIKKLNYFKEIDVESTVTYDFDMKKLISRNYSSFGGMGFDSIYYMNGDDSFIKMPMVGKYINLDDTNMYYNYDEEDGNALINEEKITKLKDKCLDLLKKDDVFTGKSTVLKSPDGEIKATHYMIKLTSEQMKMLINHSINIIAGKNEFKDVLTKYSKEDIDEATLNKFYKDFEKIIKEINFDDFEINIYVDIDGFIIKNDFETQIEIQKSKPGQPKRFSIVFELNRWNIEKEQEFDFPLLTLENTLDQESLEQGIPFMFEGLFEIDDKKGRE